MTSPKINKPEYAKDFLFIITCLDEFTCFSSGSQRIRLFTFLKTPQGGHLHGTPIYQHLFTLEPRILRQE